MKPGCIASRIAAAVLLVGATTRPSLTAQSAATPIVRPPALSNAATTRDLPMTPSRRVWAGPIVDKLKFPPSLSPDGKLLAFADMASGELAVRDIATGETRRLTNGAWDQKTEAFASFTAFSRDGRQIAYEWYNATNPSYELRIIGLDGTAPRVLRHPPDKGVARPHDWTPDGRYVATTVIGDRSSRLELVPTSGGTPRLLKSFPDWRRPADVRVSPDGKYLAYDCPPRPDAIDRYVFLLAVDGSRESAVVSWPGDTQVIGWTPDGSLAFLSQRGGSPAIWAVRVEAGRAMGQPSIVRKDLWRSVGLNLTANGTLLYAVETGDRDVYSASFDSQAGKLLSKPVGLTQHPGDSYTGLAFSPDGRSMAYLTALTQKITYSRYSVVGGATVTIQSLEGGARRTMRPKVAGLRAFVQWGPNDRSIFVLARDDKGRDTLQLLDLRTGEAAVTDRTPPSILSADRHWMYQRASPDTSMNGSPLMTRVVARRVGDVEERELYAAPAGHAIDTPLLLSPDRRWLVFNIGNYPSFNRDRRTHVLLLPTEGGAARDLLPPDDFPGRFPVAAQFTPDGRSVLLVTIDPSSEQSNIMTRRLWRVSFPSGKTQEIDLSRSDFDLVRLSPDGRRIIFTAGNVSTELWLLEEPALGFRDGESALRQK